MQKFEAYFGQFRFYREWHEQNIVSKLNWGILIAISFAIAGFIANHANSLVAQLESATEVQSENIASIVTALGAKRVQVIESTPLILESQETNQVLVKYKNSAKGNDKDNVEKREKLKSKKTIKGIDVVVYEIDADDSAAEVVGRLNALHGNKIEFAEIDIQMPPAFIPNDPYFGSAWHLPKMQAPTAWDSTTGAGITVASVDTGVDSKHQDLSFGSVVGWNFYNNNADITDVYGHGTKVAGTMGAVGNNALGVVGVAPAAKVLGVRIAGPDGYASFSTAAQGIIYAADNGARVVNLSYSACNSASVISAARYLRSKGGVLTVSAGNTGADNGMPASPDIICVSATDQNDTRASWSSWGASVDVTAPGTGIYTTTSGGGYGAPSGTSFSAPLVGGVYALIFSMNPALTPAQADNIIFSTADDLGSVGWDAYYGFGRVNAVKAVALASSTRASQGAADTTAPSTPLNLSASNVTTSGVTLNWSPSTDNVLVTQYDVFRNGTKVASASTPPYTNSGLSEKTTYTYTVVARDAAGNASTQSQPVSVTTPPAPLVITSASVSTKTGTTATVNVTTNKATSVTVQYGLTPTNLAGTVTSSTTANSHLVNLTGLSPKAKYYYKVIATTAGGETLSSAVSNFRTASR